MLSGELQCFTLALFIVQAVQLFHISEYSQVFPQSHNIMVKFGNFSIGSDSIWHTHCKHFYSIVTHCKLSMCVQ